MASSSLRPLLARLSHWFAVNGGDAGGDAELALREAMRQLRANLRRRGGGSAPARLTSERFARRKSREVMNAIKRRPRVQLDKPLLVARYRASALLDALLPGRQSRWTRILSRRRTEAADVIDLENFSFIHNPAGTLAALKRIAETEGRSLNAHLNFNDDYCVDIGPYVVLGEIWPAMAPIYLGGRMVPAVQKVIKAVGLQRQLGMSLKGAQTLKDIWAYPLQRRRPAGSSSSPNLQLEPQRRERVADGLCDAIDEWLGQLPIEQELTDEGRGWIGMIVGELLDNAERHSRIGEDGDWSIAAFMARRVEDGQEVFRCHLAFLSVGVTMAESLASAAPHIAADLSTYCARHAGGPTSEATLRTLFALQDGITRDPQAAANGRGGTGLQEVLDLVSELGQTDKAGREPRITIISGTSCIRLQAPYIKGERKGGETSPRVLWCNPENTPDSPPDAAHAFDLTERFAGTIISVAFTLDPDYLNATLESGETDDDGDQPG